MNTHLRWLFLASLMLSVTTMACGFVGGAFGAMPTPTGPKPTPSPIGPESVSTLTAATAIPTVMPTTQPAGPIESIAITAPLPGQGVRNSIHIEGHSDLTFNQQLSILVRDANGNVIGSAAAQIQAGASQRGSFSADVPLDPGCPTQPGRVVVYATAARDGGPTHLSTVDVQLNSDAPANVAGLNPNRTESIVITTPALNAVISSAVKVSGFSDSTFEQTLIVEVRGQSNNQLGRVTTTVAAAPGQRGAFSVDVPFQSFGNQPGRIVVYTISPRDGKTVHLNSVEVRLDP